MTDYEIQENFLKKVAQMYTTFSADPIVDKLAARFHYSSMWVCDEIKSRTAYLYYITRKLEAMKNSGVRFNFVMMYKQGDGKPVLMFSPKRLMAVMVHFSLKVTNPVKLHAWI